MLLRETAFFRAVVGAAVGSALALGMVTTAFAQEVQTPKAEVFAGYSWYNAGQSKVNGAKFPDMRKGFGVEGTYNFNRFLGATVDYSKHFGEGLEAYTIMGGPQVKYRTDQVSPFAHVLLGWENLSPRGLKEYGHFATAVGGGIDIEAGRWFAIRLIQGDWIHTEYNNNAALPTHVKLDGPRLQTGLLLKLGTPAAEGPVAATCAVQPTAVMAGEPVRASITPNGFMPKRTLTYGWTSTGGKAAGETSATTIDTTGLAPGNYTVTGKVTDNGKGKHQRMATCNAAFTVNEPPKRPPVMSSCTPSAASVRAGDPVTITSTANSPDNRPLTYEYTASAGRISGTGPSATLDTAGVPAGTVNVTCKVSDDRGLTSTGNTAVAVEAVPEPPKASKVGSINFVDPKKPARVDNAAKAALDDVALRLQREPDAKAVVVGYGADTRTAKNLAAQRAVNTKAYLTDEKGIDPSRIEVRQGTGDQATADIWVVPTGATFDEAGTTPVNESKIKPMKKAPAPAKRKAAKKAAPAPAAQ